MARAGKMYGVADRRPRRGVILAAIFGDGRGCTTLTVRVQIHELIRDASRLVRSLATFAQHGEGGPNALRGCIRYAHP